MHTATTDPRALAIASHGATLSLDETGDFPLLTITSTLPLPRATARLCHALAGDMGAGIIFTGAAP